MADLIVHYRRLVGMAKSWAVKSLPGYTQDSHADLLQRHGASAVPGKDGTPRISATTLSVAQLKAVLAEYERRGFVHQSVGPSASGKTLDGQVRMIFGLWGGLATSGKVRDSSRASLCAWASRHLGCSLPDDLAKLSTADKNKLIEQLKRWAVR